jgi:hypothetical protein
MKREEELLIEEVDLLLGIVDLTLVRADVDAEVELQLLWHNHLLFGVGCVLIV